MALNHDTAAGQAQGLVEQNQKRLRQLAAERMLSLLDARELTGERLRLWNVHGDPRVQVPTSLLAERFGDVLWTTEPRPGSIWVFSTLAADNALPPQAQAWRGAPVGVLWVETTQSRSDRVKGFEAQEKMRTLFNGFSQAQFLGVLSSPADADLLDYQGADGRFFLFVRPLAWVQKNLARQRSERLRKQISIFYKWCMEWRHRHWMQDASVGRIKEPKDGR